MKKLLVAVLFSLSLIPVAQADWYDDFRDRQERWELERKQEELERRMDWERAERDYQRQQDEWDRQRDRWEEQRERQRYRDWE